MTAIFTSLYSNYTGTPLGENATLSTIVFLKMMTTDINTYLNLSNRAQTPAPTAKSAHVTVTLDKTSSSFIVPVEIYFPAGYSVLDAYGTMNR